MHIDAPANDRIAVRSAGDVHEGFFAANDSRQRGVAFSFTGAPTHWDREGEYWRSSGRSRYG